MNFKINFRISGLYLLMSFALLACSDEPETRLEGTRVPISLESSSLQADPTLQSAPVSLRAPFALPHWLQSGSSALHDPGNIAYSLEFDRIWQRNIGSGNSGNRRLLAEPLVAGGFIFTMDSNYRLSALDSQNGKILWQMRLPRNSSDSDSFGGGIALDEGRLFATDGYGNISAVNAQDGTLLWQQHLLTPLRAAPSVAGDIVLVTGIDNQTTAFSSDDGTILWNHQAFQENVGVVGTGAAAIIGNLAIVPYSSGEIYGLRLNDGSVLWQENLSVTSRSSALAELGDISAHPVIVRDRVYAISNGGRLMSLDAATGSPVWQVRLSGGESPAISGDYLFVISNSSQLVAIRLADGAVRWERQLPHWRNPEARKNLADWRGPLLVDGKLLLTNRFKEAILVSPENGEIEREFELKGAAQHIIAAMEKLYILYDNGDVVAYQ